MRPLVESVYGAKGLYQQLLAPLCKKYSLTDTEVIILLYLADPNPADTATKIVKAQRLKKAVVSVSIFDLEKRGLISSYFEENDHRTKHLKINDSAEDIINEAIQIQEEYYGILTQGLNEKQLEELDRFLVKINGNIGRYSL